MNFAVVVFPGSNSDHDAFHAASAVLGERASLVWHKDTIAGRCRCGDPARRLRPRRLPAHRRDRPLLADHGRRWRAFAERGGPVLGICNGFQVLLEAGLLPGAMVRNRGIKFVSRIVPVRVEPTDTPFTQACARGPGAAAADRARRGQLLRRRRNCWPRSRRTVRWCSATWTRPARPTDDRQPQRLAPQHRRHLQRGPQRRRPDAPPGARLARRRWAAPMGASCSSRWSRPMPTALSPDATRRPGRRWRAHEHRHRPGRPPPARPHRRASTRASRS